MDYSISNKKTYDELAEEYEERVDALQTITENAMEWFSSFIKPDGFILDIGCGVGIAINVLSKKNFKMTGIEISPKMAIFAKKRNPKVDIIVGDFLTTDFNNRFDAILAFAFVHLFPKKEIDGILKKIKSLLNNNGVVLISTTESLISKEGWEIKDDYNKKKKRFRKFWKDDELRETIQNAEFEVLDFKKFNDPFGKVWIDFIAKKESAK